MENPIMFIDITTMKLTVLNLTIQISGLNYASSGTLTLNFNIIIVQF